MFHERKEGRSSFTAESHMTCLIKQQPPHSSNIALARTPGRELSAGTRSSNSSPSPLPKRLCPSVTACQLAQSQNLSFGIGLQHALVYPCCCYWHYHVVPNVPLRASVLTRQLLYKHAGTHSLCDQKSAFLLLLLFRVEAPQLKFRGLYTEPSCRFGG